MPDIISITDPGWPLDFTIWVLILPVALLLVAGIFWMVSMIIRGRNRQRRAEEWAAGVGFASLIVGIVALFVLAVGGNYIYGDQVTQRIEAAMEDEGFSELEIEYDSGGGTTFVGSFEGDYIRGALLEDGDLTYQIVELVNK